MTTTDTNSSPAVSEWERGIASTRRALRALQNRDYSAVDYHWGRAHRMAVSVGCQTGESAANVMTEWTNIVHAEFREDNS